MPDESDLPRDVLAAEGFAVPASDPALVTEEAHDVLAAEEFAVPGRDPALDHSPARDVLAAEEFGVPASDARLRIISQPLVLPADPQDPRGSDPARDVLAAEEFAVPGVAAPHPATQRRSSLVGAGPLLLVAGAALVRWRRRRLRA